MNVKRKTSAVTRYQQSIAEGKSQAEITALLEADEKNYTPEEQKEILDVLFPEGDNGAGSDSKDDEEKKKTKTPPSTPKNDEDPLAVRKYAVYKAEPIYEYEIDRKTGDKVRVFKGVDKKGEPFRHTNVEKRHADELNAQVENSKIWYEAV